MMIYRYIIPGPAVPQGRPRFSTAGGWPRAYDPPKSREYKELVRSYIMQQRRAALKSKAMSWNDMLILGPVSVTITEHRKIPKAWSKKKKRDALDGKIRPVQKPDIDNIAKAILDAVKGQIWADDAQVIALTASKRYSDDPRVEIEIEELEAS